MTVKSTGFFAAHLAEHTAKKAGLEIRALKKVATVAGLVGGFSYEEALKLVAKAEKSDLNKLVELLSGDEGDESEDQVDEGHVKQHDYVPVTTVNGPFEPAGVNPYSIFSVPEALTGY